MIECTSAIFTFFLCGYTERPSAPAPPPPPPHSYCWAGIWLAGCWPWTKELLPLAHMSERRKQELSQLRSIYTVNMAGYKSAPVTSSESSSICIMLSLWGGLIYSSAVRWATSNVHWGKGLSLWVWLWVISSLHLPKSWRKNRSLKVIFKNNTKYFKHKFRTHWSWQTCQYVYSKL